MPDETRRALAQLQPKRQRRPELLVLAAAIILMAIAGLRIADRVGHTPTRSDVAAAKTKTDSATRLARGNRTRIVHTDATIVQQLPGRFRIGPNGLTGRPGAGASDAQVAAAVAAFCGATGCGRGPTQDEVLAALRLCAAGGGCRGPAGSPGPAGKDSTVPGPQGLPGNDGADGAPSTVPGPTGPQGPPVGSFTFTDATGLQQSCSDSDGDGAFACVAAPVVP